MHACTHVIVHARTHARALTHTKARVHTGCTASGVGAIRVPRQSETGVQAIHFPRQSELHATGSLLQLLPLQRLPLQQVLLLRRAGTRPWWRRQWRRLRWRAMPVAAGPLRLHTLVRVGPPGHWQLDIRVGGTCRWAPNDTKAGVRRRRRRRRRRCRRRGHRGDRQTWGGRARRAGPVRARRPASLFVGLGDSRS